MKLLIKIATFLAIVYLVLMIHSIMYGTKQKNEEITQLSLHVKDVEPSLAYRSDAYKRFVYAK